MKVQPLATYPDVGGPGQLLLNPGDDLDIPLDTRFEELKTQYANLILWLVDQRFPVPSDQIEYMQGVIK